MAPIKRKNESVTDFGSTRPEKKQKPSSTPKLSVLRDEEPAFPRGGASILTPLEHKQIRVQAKQDVLFEQATGTKVARKDFENAEDDEDMPGQEDAPASKTRARPRLNGKKNADDTATKERGVRIEGLSYKRLVPGSIVLGQVSQINHYDLSLSLPNNLTGFVPLTSISDTFTQKLEAVATDQEHREDDAEAFNDDAMDFRQMVSVGQYLRAYVTSTQHEESSGAKGKRHIELSIKPQQANIGLSKTELVTNSMIQAAVLSVEDHGLIMDLGLEDKSVRGFMSSRELGHSLDTSKIKEGSVYFCLVTGKSSNGNIIKLSADPSKIGNIKKGAYLTDAPTIDTFLPGTAVEILISQVTPSGIAGKVMGLLDVTADFVHSGAASSGKDLEKKFSVGSKIKGRVICTFPTIEEKKIGMSLQDHIVYWRPKTTTATSVMENILPTLQLPVSAILEQAIVVKVEQGSGLLLDVGVKGVRGFVHISQISDNKIETLSETSGPYKLGTRHKARIVGYNSMDGLFIVSTEPKVIARPFLRVEDVKAGQIVKGTIEKLIVNASGINGLLVNITEGITGLVPSTHFADIQLQYPEKKFKEGSTVTARVLSTNPEKRQLRMTLKKSLVNSDVEPWTSYVGLKPGMQAPGTLVNILPAGAVVQFYARVRAFLPISEMSESYIEDPKQHFKIGQVVNVHILSVDAEDERMTVSCKDPSMFGTAQIEAFKNLELGTSVVGHVTEMTSDEIIVDIEPSSLKAILSIRHLADGSAQKCQSIAKRIRVGQILKDLIVMNKKEARYLVGLTSKPSLLKAANEGRLLRNFEDVKESSEVQGFVQNVTPTGVYVQFGGDVVALLLKRHLPEESVLLPDFGMQKNQSITARVHSVDYSQRRFLLTLRPLPEVELQGPRKEKDKGTYDNILSNPVDGVSVSIDEFTQGKLTKAKIVSIKNTQMNVQLADAVQGRIDVSEVFDNWEEIGDRKHPLKRFRAKQILPVRILGMHDSRNHRFLPITHRGRAMVFELTAKPSNQVSEDLSILTIDKVEVGSTWLAFVNNVSVDCVWVNLSPNVRGRIRAMDVSDNVSQLKDLARNFPIGSALKAKVLKIDVENNHLDLSARSESSSSLKTMSDIAAGSVLPARVTKVTERQIIVQLSESLSAPIHLVDLADDYSKADPTIYQKNQTIRIYVKGVDPPNTKITLSTRPSKILSSSLPVKDPDITTISQLKINDVVRGFIKNVADNGIFISLASNVTAFIRISDLSDAFLKDWKTGFEIDQLIEGKVIAVDPMLNHIQMSLKRSHLDKDYKPLLTFPDMKHGDIITGKVRKIEDFGVFIVVDDSANVSGLCHKSQMSDQASVNPKQLYEEGDAVKAKILNINKAKRQISFGLKASYIQKGDGRQVEEEIVQLPEVNGASSESDDEVSNLDEVLNFEDGITGDLASNISEEDALEVDMENVPEIDSDIDMNGAESGGVDVFHHGNYLASPSNGKQGLNAGGFDWTAGLSGMDDAFAQSKTDAEFAEPKKKKKRRKAEIEIDRTGDLDTYGPQSVADFERLLMGRPNSSVLWLQYMAFQLGLNEVTNAREIAERALKTIHIREESEKLNVWIAMLNLENTYGDDESLDVIFKRACQYNDSLEIHSRLASIYIQSHAHSKADDLFQATLKKHSQSPDLYTNYATFLMTELGSPDRAHALLPRAMQALPPHTHLTLNSKFAQLEFTTPHGSPERGRTVFETLLSQWPKRLDLWNVLLDLEIKQGDKEITRRLFERVTGSGTNLKARKAKFFFKKWLDWEMKSGEVKNQERVKALAAEYVRSQGKQVDLEYS